MRVFCAVVVLCISSVLSAQETQSSERADTVDAGLEAALAIQNQIAKVAKDAKPVVVTVHGYLRLAEGETQATQPTSAPVQMGWGDPAGARRHAGYKPYASASGVMVTTDGDVLTCANFLQQKSGQPVDLVDVELEDGRHVISELISIEPTVNLAIVRMRIFAAGVLRLPTIRFGDSTTLEVGHTALAMGNPDGPGGFFAIGAISALPDRDCYQELLTSFYLQTSLAVPPQAYGGPLLNVKGEVMGLLCPRNPEFGPHVLGPRDGVEYVLPSSIITGLYKSMIANPTFRSPWLGFAVMSRAELVRKIGLSAFNEMRKPERFGYGIYIENVFKPSPAATAGIEPGDFLVSFNGNLIMSPIEFQANLYLTGIGHEADLEMFRNGKTYNVKVKIEPRPPEAITR